MVKEQRKIKLLRKSSRPFLWISFGLLAISALVLYFYLRFLLRNAVEEELRSTVGRVENSIKTQGSWYELPPIVEVAMVSKLGKEQIKDTLMYDPSQNELEEFRELNTYMGWKGENYRITVRALIVESNEILITVNILYGTITVLVFLFLYYFNNKATQKLWFPFFENLNKMKQFSVSSQDPLLLMDSDILEFTELNTEITTLTEKVQSDYKNLKQFTENVSHELQTPLAIIQAKIDTIINGEGLNNSQFEQLSSIQKDIQRLKQLNKRLGLLSKIENEQFTNVKPCKLNEVLRDRIEHLSELYPAKIILNVQKETIVIMDAHLAEVLCDNLLSNAIKYATPNTPITIDLQKNALTVKNKGTCAILKPELLFNRFYRETDELKSTGLGLAIVKKICDFYGFTPSYSHENGTHNFIVNFEV
ncbi:sensor histidine kinase [Maribacter sp. X9]|uniref:sensor histidine kinase n=1 Tax=Maribacter sp. X9 TaxID=3402159 RepID=UPI003AF3FF46